MEKSELLCPKCGQGLKQVSAFGEYLWVHAFLEVQGPSEAIASCPNFRKHLDDDGKVMSMDKLRQRQKERWEKIKEGGE